jgi:hypothetical protein
MQKKKCGSSTENETYIVKNRAMPGIVNNECSITVHKPVIALYKAPGSE